MTLWKKNTNFSKYKILLITIFFISSLQRSFANNCGSWFSNLTAPLCTDAKYIFWTGATLTAGLRFLKKQKGVDQIQQSASQKNHLQHFGQFGGSLGYGYLNATYFLGNLIIGGKNGRKRAEHMLEASLYTLGITLGLKDQIQEPRPGYPNKKDSFPSGHASASFAFASVVTAHHGWGAGSLAHLAAIFISFSRLNDDWHYLHDVIAGMTIGMSYGWGIYYNHKEHNKPYWFSLLPTDNLDGMVVSYSINF